MIPGSVNEITRTWLTGILRSSLVSDDEVVQYQLEPLDEFGIMSSLWRVSVSYSRQSTVGSKTLIIKLPSCDAKTREIANSGGFYEREVRFYKEFSPHRDVPAPTLYHADIDPDSGNFVIVLEDLGNLTHGDQETEPSLGRVRRALHSLARMHASWWESPELADAHWLLRWPDEESARGAMGAFEGSWRMFLERSDFHVPAELENAGGEIAALMPEVAAEMSRPPRTLLHGDFHPPNTFFNDPATGREVVAVDWQVAAHGRCTFDAACVLATWLSPETRRKRQHDLLADYHRQLLDLGARGYSLEDCVRDYRLSVIFLFMNTVFTRLRFLPQNDRDRLVMNEAWARIASATSDILSQ